MTRSQERECTPALKVVSSGLREVDTGVVVHQGTVDTDIDTADGVRHLDYAVEGDDSGELDVETGELRKCENHAGKATIRERCIERLCGVVLVVIPVEAGALGDSHDHVAGKADGHCRLAVFGNVQDHVDIVELARGVFNGAADAALAGASIATGDKNVETALEATDLRRRALGLPDKSDRVALAIDAVKSNGADSGTTYQKDCERSSNDLRNRSPRSGFLQPTVTCHTLNIGLFLGVSAFDRARTQL